MKVLVTGGAGFIGGATVRELIAFGNEVTVFDNLECGHAETIPKGVTLIKGDLRDGKSIMAALAENKYDAVMHFAAYTIVPESVKDPSKYVWNNLLASFNLLEAMIKNGVEKLVFSSSAAVYGSPQSVPIEEDAATRPENPYGETKLTIEQYLKWYDTAYGLKNVCLRYFNAAGADLENDIGEDRAVETHLIPLVLHAASGKKKSVNIFGSDYPTRDGTCIRDYIHVKDLASAHVLALNKLNGNNDSSSVYNLGSEQGFTVLEVVKAAEKITGRKINAKMEGRRLGDPPSLIASSSKIKKELNWSQKHSTIEKIISDTWQWMQRHPEGYAGR